MRKITTTTKINEAISNNLLRVTKAEIYHKTSRKTETIDADRFHEDFGFFCESGFFADALGWHYEWDYKTGLYEIETGRKNSDSEIIITAYFSVCNGACRENVDKVLEMTEEE